MSRNVKSLADALAEAPGAAAWLARLRVSETAARLVASSDVVRAAGFDATQPGACELRDGTLFLTANSAACAAKLRQGLPRLQKLLQQQGFEVIEMRVRVQPTRSNYREGTSGEADAEGRSVGAGTASRSAAELRAPLAFADKLALTLPDTPLKHAAERLRLALRRAVTRNG